MAFHPNDTNFENGLFFRKTIYSTIWKGENCRIHTYTLLEDYWNQLSLNMVDEA
jgi:hypothetical protein